MGVAAVEAQAVPVHAAGGEQLSGDEGHALGQSLCMQGGRIHIIRQFHPQDEAALGLGKPGAGREMAGHRGPHGLDLLFVVAAEGP